MYARFHIGPPILMVLLSCGCGTHDAASGMIEPDSSTGISDLQHHPTLGAGTSQDGLRTFRRCVTNADSKVPLAFQGRDYQETSIHSRRQLNEVLSFDASAAASGFWGEASGSVNSLNGLEMIDENFYWLVYAKYDLSMDHIDTGSDEFSLTADAKTILKNHGLEGFYRACGTSFYSGRRLGARYGLLYEFIAHDEKSIERLKAMGSYGGFGVKATAEFEHVLSLAAKSNSLKVHSYIQGGGEKVAEYAMNPTDLKKEFSQLREDLFKNSHGIAVEWTTQGYDIFDEIQAAEKESPASREMADLGRRTALSEFYNLYTQNRDRIAQIKSLLARASGEEPLVQYSGPQRASLEDGIRRLYAQNTDIDKRARLCLDNHETTCDLTDLAPLHIDIVEPERNFTSMGNWHAEFRLNEERAPVLDIILTHVTTGERRVMDTGRYIYDGAFGVTLMAGEEFEELGLKVDGPMGQYVLGKSDQVIDPISRTRRPDVCVYNNAHRCHLRVVPIGGTKGGFLNDDNLKVQLILYNEQGFPLSRRIEFPQKINTSGGLK